jgi:dTDP-4-dehydrorhamnose reductase
MRILVTGRHGQVARCLAHINDGHELRFLARPDIDLRAPLASREPVLRARPDVILSCAALTNVDACEADPAAAFAINAEAPGVLARAAAELNIPIIHLSTDYVFGGRQRTPYRETDPPDPINVYGRSKLAGEQAVAEARRHAVVRTTWVYSPFGGFLTAARAQVVETGAARVVSDQVACPTSGLDLARGLLAMAEHMQADDARHHGVFHGAGAAAARRSEVIRSALPWARVVEMTSQAFFNGAPRPLYSALDSSKLSEVFGIRLRGWREAMAEAVQS